VAVYLASQRPVAGVVLVTPYDSMLAVAQEHYPYLPASLLLRHRFDSISYAARIHAPLLTLAAADDTVIPYVHAQRLQRAWAGESEWKLLPDTNHLNISRSPEFWQYIRDFLGKLATKRL
jgi:pimeloyl-ACP methyl ester carboxylesterase